MLPYLGRGYLMLRVPTGRPITGVASARNTVADNPETLE